MEITFRLSKKEYGWFLRALQNYEEHGFYDKDFAAPEFEKNPGCYTITHCTGNTWAVKSAHNDYYLTYTGSREGFHALTPFRQCKNPRVIYITRWGLELQTKKLRTIILPKDVKSTAPLEWWQRIRKCLNEPTMGVVVDEQGYPLKTMSYKNVYNP